MKIFERLVYCVAVVTLVVTAGCSSGKPGDINGLLETVPADASAVMVMNMHAMLEKAGCKVNGSEVVPGKELASVLETTNNQELKKIIAGLRDGGIDPSAAALFIEGYNVYLTGFVSDSSKFKEYVEKNSDSKFVKDGEAEVCGNTVLTPDRFWICMSSRNTVNTEDIRRFVSLSPKQSILSNEVASRLADISHDVEGWGDIKGCLNSLGLDFTTRATATMAIEAMFVDAVEFSWNLDFQKGKIVAEMDVINSKGGIAKFNFPAARIDGGTITETGGTADAFVALAVNPDVVKKLKEETGGKGMSMIGILAGMIQSVDGTCVAAVSESGNVRGVISTTGHGTADLSNMLGQFGFEVVKEGRLLRVGKGAVEGAVSAADAAEELKGSLAGFVLGGGDKRRLTDAVSSVSVTFKPEKGGLKAIVKVNGKDSKKNIMQSILESHD